MVESHTPNSEMENSQNHSIVVSCIDFRTIEKARQMLRDIYGLEDGDYSLLATAGAALNPITPKLIDTNSSNQIIDLNHKDCGYAKKTGSDDTQRHQKEMVQFGEKLKTKNSNIDYQSNLINVEGTELRRHHCQVTAILKGSPTIVQQAREKLDLDGYTDDHDEIARPQSLNDPTILDDLEISLNLHDPKEIFIFGDDQIEVDKLTQRAKEVAKKLSEEVQVTPIIIPKS